MQVLGSMFLGGYPPDREARFTSGTTCSPPRSGLQPPPPSACTTAPSGRRWTSRRPVGWEYSLGHMGVGSFFYEGHHPFCVLGFKRKLKGNPELWGGLPEKDIHASLVPCALCQYPLYGHTLPRGKMCMNNIEPFVTILRDMQKGVCKNTPGSVCSFPLLPYLPSEVGRLPTFDFAFGPSKSSSQEANSSSKVGNAALVNEVSLNARQLVGMHICLIEFLAAGSPF